jgi:hypothetical protein
LLLLGGEWNRFAYSWVLHDNASSFTEKKVGKEKHPRTRSKTTVPGRVDALRLLADDLCHTVVLGTVADAWSTAGRLIHDYLVREQPPSLHTREEPTDEERPDQQGRQVNPADGPASLPRTHPGLLGELAAAEAIEGALPRQG